MAVVFDASVLIDLFNKRLTGDRRVRLDHLIKTLSKQRTKVLIPTPALAEFLVRDGYSDGPDIARAAARLSIPVYPTSSLPMPASALQQSIRFEATGDDGEGR